MKKGFKAMIIIGTVVLVIGGGSAIAVSVFNNHGINYINSIPSKINPSELTHYEMETIKAKGRGLYDKDGNRFHIQGINFGNWLIQEGWMSVNQLGVALNADGSYASVGYDGEGNPQYIEGYEPMFQEKLIEALEQNPNNFTSEQIETLWDTYHYSYCQEEDFRRIKEIGLNTIRLPMYYRNFMEGSDEELTWREDAFELIDYFLDNAKKYDLKVILDMHGVVGGQSGHEHSGTRDRDFWTTENYIVQTCELWKGIATYYRETRPDLAETILAYDLINEPAYQGSYTSKLQWDVMDRIYDAIREVDKDHIISIEGCWHFNNLPNPQKYGWENILYQYHIYNWDYNKIKNDVFYTYHWSTFALNDYNVPKFIGEFTFFDQENEWVKYLNKYDQRGLGWTIWTYKTMTVGWWDSSWGLYVYRMNLNGMRLKLDPRIASYDEIYEVWSKVGPEQYNQTGLMYRALTRYFNGEGQS